MATDSICPHHSPSHLETLPRELMWMLLDCVPETVHRLNLRAASRTMRSRIFTYASGRFNVPMARIFTCSTAFNKYAKREPVSVLDAHFAVYAQRVNLFELRMVSQSGIGVALSMTHRKYFDDLKIAKQRLKEDKIYYINLNDLTLLEHWNNAIGTTFDIVELDDRHNRVLHGAIAKLLERKQFNELVYRFDRLSQKSVEQLLKYVKYCQVEHITISGGSLEAPVINEPNAASVIFLVELSALVRSVRVTQQFVSGMNNVPFMLGTTSFRWERAILEMFSNKLDKLLIENFYYSDYLSEEGANNLAKNLPLAGKPVWFSASVSPRTPSRNVTLNDHIIDVVSSVGFAFLTIKHHSRINEPF